LHDRGTPCDGAAVATPAGLFLRAWAGFVFKGHALEELDQKANLRGESQARDRSA
jgi:hypothetical protein